MRTDLPDSGSRASWPGPCPGRPALGRRGLPGDPGAAHDFAAGVHRPRRGDPRAGPPVRRGDDDADLRSVAPARHPPPGGARHRTAHLAARPGSVRRDQLHAPRPLRGHLRLPRPPGCALRRDGAAGGAGAGDRPGHEAAHQADGYPEHAVPGFRRHREPGGPDASGDEHGDRLRRAGAYPGQVPGSGGPRVLRGGPHRDHDRQPGGRGDHPARGGRELRAGARAARPRRLRHPEALLDAMLRIHERAVLAWPEVFDMPLARFGQVG